MPDFWFGRWGPSGRNLSNKPLFWRCQPAVRPAESQGSNRFLSSTQYHAFFFYISRLPLLFIVHMIASCWILHCCHIWRKALVDTLVCNVLAADLFINLGYFLCWFLLLSLLPCALSCLVDKISCDLSCSSSAPLVLFSLGTATKSTCMY